ncbi:diguanylate cyclase/phosphodiesterase domain-containing protein [Secundilactobacillus pentosiphilus]|uniref:Diguanylate cyclase/phosphodiesterase domain-containing protein n=1 Tax=Secundilactobacillus pentosiphilus TaxID=1714682 RepID=A0A1Z5IPY5_9LACO|nr:GGDEF domain-containing protein [Secundilactobacillus pentosiphilus]GAX03815.1 diguanylate cyclase/phosphodiesterase domain-containing protein [Secundilactobacillus pentosiphilus]
MGATDIWASFILSLLTNVIVLSGSISFIIWLEELSNSWIKRFRPALEVILCSLYFTYLWGESWLNSAVAPEAFGLHWAFLNMLIVSSFLVNVYLKLWLEAFFESALMLTYVSVYSTHFSFLTMMFSLGFIGVIFVSYHWGADFFKRPWLMYLGMDAMAFVSIGLIATMFKTPFDPYFWLRQITALVILSIVGIEYTLATTRVLQKNQQTAELASLDGLTLLNNFTKFDEDLTAAYDHYQSNQEPYAVFEFDIDLFKQVNDSYGHLFGNTVLKAVAQEIAHFAASTPFQTTAYRIGGEEFCLILKADCSDQVLAASLANQIRRQISHLSFNVDDSTISVTVSVGQANSRPDQYNAHDIYKLADRSLYMSKERGRNRVTLEGQTITPTNQKIS